MRRDLQNALFFVNAVQQLGPVWEANASLISNQSAANFNAPTWTAWLIGDQSIEVNCVRRTLEWIGSGSDVSNKHIVLYDEEPYLHSSSSGVVAAAENLVRVQWEVKELGQDGSVMAPVFLSPDKNHHVCSAKAVINFSVNTMWQLPDVQAYWTLFNNGYESAIRDRQPTKALELVREMLHQFVKIADSLVINVGHRLLASIKHGEASTPLVVLIEEEVQPHVFDVCLFSPKPMINILPGDKIIRDVVQQEADDQRTFHAEIGTILSIVTI
jgi:hypothetical protein